MSYYRPSFAQTTGNMSRGGGRGGSFSSSRGSSYRGSGRGSNSWNSSSSRGYHGPNSRGGNNSGSTTYRSSGGYPGGSFDASRSVGKYSSSGGERISFRGSGGEESYRKTYRPDPTYSRESRLSPERKRMRTESRHDVYAGSGGESGGMSSSRYVDSNDHRRSSMQEFNRNKFTSSSPFGGGGSHRMSSASDFRKPLAPPPPPNISSGGYSSSSGGGGRSYRGGGRGIAPRGSRYIVNNRDTSRSGTTLHRPPPRRLMDYSTSTSASTTWRSTRGGSSIRSSDYARRLRLRQLTNRSAIIRSNRPIVSSRIKSRNDSDDELWGVVRDDDDDDEDDEEEEEEDDDNDEKEAIKEIKESADDNDAEKAEKKVADDSKDEKEIDDEEEEKDSEEVKKETDDCPTEVSKKKSSTKRVSSSKENREHDASMDNPLTYRNKFIKLICPYCHTRCITFSRYNMHLRSARHSAAMHHVALKQKSVLSRMRIKQRAEQKEIERASDETELTTRTNFCPLCKLNYRQAKIIHRASKAHRDMKRFLMPVCKTCNITCKSPMLYETHCCSLEHIKRKAYSTTNGDKSDKSEHSGDDLQNYMTIDSVGDMDDIDMEIPPPPSVTAAENVKECSVVVDPIEGDNKQPTVSKIKSERHSSASSTKREREPQINVGVENIRKIEVHYCDLCRMYLPRVEDVHDDLDRILAKHCKQRTHMQRYIRYKEDKDLAKRAERLQRREMAEKEKDAKRSTNTSTASKDDQNKSASSSDSTQKNNSAAQLSGDSTASPAAIQEESNVTVTADDSSLNDTDITMGEEEAQHGDDDDKLVDEKEANDVKEIQEADEAEAGDDKLWEDVDKDLGDILAGENKSCASDEEEEDDDNSVVNGERYDRFKYSEKNAKTGNVGVGKNPPMAAKKAESEGGGVGGKSQVEGDSTK